ncbi:MAG: GlsB/YeaQ/YmgE family stress response membrane protein [Spirochaetes bacterium]|nr:GlsB/YeaQ/YmgE family stress response membrane protein [Spirochaetota bacterium]HPA71436.1 GlsB/YeaQ/YmgE family stress response membrane protein [Spirochaetota bacterium]
MGLISWIIVGLVAGWLAGLIWKGGGFGLIGNLVVGVVGAILGGWILGILGFSHYGLIGTIITAVIGALILLWVINKIKK